MFTIIVIVAITIIAIIQNDFDDLLINIIDTFLRRIRNIRSFLKVER